MCCNTAELIRQGISIRTDIVIWIIRLILNENLLYRKKMNGKYKTKGRNIYEVGLLRNEKWLSAV